MSLLGMQTAQMSAGSAGYVRATIESLEARQLLSAVASVIPVDPVGMIAGRVVADTTVAGKTVEKPLSKVTLYLDANNDRLMQPNERQATTDANGNYAFIALPAGTYEVRQAMPLGYQQLAPLHSAGRAVKLSPNQHVAGQNFTDIPSPTSWNDYAGNAQHTALSAVGSQSLQKFKWTTPVDLNPQITDNDILIHYGTPLFTSNNVMILPVKTGATDGFELQGRDAGTGNILWTVPTDYVLPPHGWTPSYSPCLTADNRVYFAGAGGTIWYIDRVNHPGPKTPHRYSFYGLAAYQKYQSQLDASVYVDTPITTAPDDSIYFGVQTVGSNPLNLQGGLAKINRAGSGRFVAASTASGSAAIGKVAQNSAPALSADGKIVYVAVNRGSFFGSAIINSSDYLLALDSTTLKTIGKTTLIDPSDGSFARVDDDGTASPTVGPDGDVYFGVLDAGNQNHDRGWLLHFNKTLTQLKTPGAFGWDDTCSIVPASMVGSYHGTSSYLVMTKYNDYAGLGGTGINKIAVLDPNATEVDPVSGATTMKEVLTIAGVTPDKQFPSVPGAVREWCINTAVVDPYTDSVLAGSEDGTLYRWNLSTNTFTESIKLTNGIGEAYTPTIIGPDGTVYAINDAILFAVGT